MEKMKQLVDLGQLLASAFTALGVLLAGWQLRITKQQNQTAFEEGLNARYREIAKSLPLGALLGKQLSTSELEASLSQFYLYFDLSNEQAFLWRKKRLNEETWFNWLEGIKQHFARPAFVQAWLTLRPDLDGSFDELRKYLPQDLLQVKTSPSQSIDREKDANA